MAHFGWRGLRLLCVVLLLAVVAPAVTSHPALAAPANQPKSQPAQQVCGTVVTISTTSITLNATSGASGQVTYTIGTGVTPPPGTTMGSAVCVLLNGTTVIAFVPSGASQVCGVVTALSSSGGNTMITIFANFGASGFMSLVSPTASVPSTVVLGSDICVLQLGGNILQFISVTNGSPPPPTGLTLAKAVSDITRGTAESTTQTSYQGDTVQYRLTYNNSTGAAVSGATITDTLQAGQNFVYGTCQPIACSFSPSTQTVSFTVGTIPAGTSSSVTFRVTLSSPGPATITNVGSLSSTTNATVGSNQTTISIPAPAPGPGPVYYPPNFYYPYYPYYPSYSPYGYGASSVTICGVVTGFRPPVGGGGYLEMNGEIFILGANMPMGGVTIVVGSAYCITFTVDAFGVISSIVVASNLAGANYVCGPVSPFSPGYAPYTGYMPYPGYAPYSGYNPYAPYSPYPGYGPYSGYGPGGSYYGWGGPMMIGGYPFYVPPSTYFPFNPQYGNPYCFTMGQQGAITGSVSVVPTAATPVEEPSGHLLPGRRGES